MTDPIQHLRELIERERSWRGGAGHIAECHHEAAQRELADAVDATLPALLAVAEAARHHETVRDRESEWPEYEASRKVLQDTLAKLDEVKL